MYNRTEFIDILKKCLSTTSSLNEFARKSDVDSGYLSRIINGKKVTPPSPKVLEKIANASQGITTYEELMNVCDYLDYDLYNFSSVKELNLSHEEIDLTNKLISEYKILVQQNKSDKFNPHTYFPDNLSEKSKKKILNAFYIYSSVLLFDLVDKLHTKDYSVDKYMHFISNSLLSEKNLSNEITKKYGIDSVHLLSNYEKLNELGKKKANENIEDLTKIQEYTEKKTELGNA